MELNKKHPRSSEGEANEGNLKRLKLDSLFDKLSIKEGRRIKAPGSIQYIQENESENIKDLDSDSESDSDQLLNNSKFIINTKLKNHMIFKKSSSPKRSINTTDINSYISNKLLSHFNNVVHSNMTLIKSYNPKLVLVYRFQRWMVKLFNRFLIKYNRHNDFKVPPVKYYDKIIVLIKQNNISFSQLIEIINQENNLSLIQLKQRQQQCKANAAREFDLSVYSGVSYRYWDNVKFDNDLEMTDGSAQKVEEIQVEDDSQDFEMEIDESNYGRSYESNYGSYYDYDSKELMTA